MLLIKSIYNPALLRSDLRRVWPLLGVYTLLWVLLLPLHMLREMTDAAPEFAADCIRNILDEAISATAWVHLLMGLVLAAALFSYLASPRATYGLHGLPLSRGCQFRTHVLCGVGGVVCSNVLTFLLMVLVQCGNGVAWRQSLTWLVYSVVTFLLFFGMGVLCCMLCGWLPAVVVAYGAVNCAVLLARLLINTMCDIFYPSYNDGLFNFSPNDLVTWFTPLMRLQTSRNNAVLYENGMGSNTSALWLSLLVYGIAAVLLLAVSYLLYRIRRSERSGDTLAFRPLQPVARWAVGLLGGLGLGVVFAALIGSMQDFSLLLLCALILGLACMIGAQMLIAKTPRVFKKLWPELIALCLVITGVCGCMERDVFGYESYVPNVQQVVSVSVNPYIWHTNCNFTDPDEIAEVMEVHTYLQKVAEDVAAENASNPIVLTYSLKDGSTLSRRYRVRDEDRTGILPLLETDTFRRNLVMNACGIRSAEDLRTGYWDFNDQQMELTQEQCRALYEAILEDAAAMDMTTVDLYENERCRVGLHLQNLDGDIYADLYLNQQCVRTIQLLQDWNIIENPAQVFSVDVYEDESTAEQTYDAALLQ